MTEPTSHQLSITTGELAELLAGKLVGPSDVRLTGIEALSNAGPADLSFVRASIYIKDAAASNAGALLVASGLEIPETDKPLIFVDDPDQALVGLLKALRTQRLGKEPSGVHPSAVIDPDATVHPSAIIGPNVVIERGVSVGADTRIDAGAVISLGCVVGERCRIGANVVIGGEGFGYITDKATGTHTHLPHVGIVVIEDDVEIGPGTCIDRAKFAATRVGQGTKIDNLCQIGHNVIIGKNCIICGLVGVGGSAVIEDNVVIGGQTGLADNITVGKGAQLAARGGIVSDIPAGGIYVGSPARERSQAFREFAALKRLAAPKNKKRPS